MRSQPFACAHLMASSRPNVSGSSLGCDLPERQTPAGYTPQFSSTALSSGASEGGRGPGSSGFAPHFAALPNNADGLLVGVNPAGCTGGVELIVGTGPGVYAFKGGKDAGAVAGGADAFFFGAGVNFGFSVG